MKRLLFVLALLFCGTTAARAESLPEDMRGTWAAPSCENPVDALVYTDRFGYEITQAGTFLSRLDKVERVAYRSGVSWRLTPADYAYDIRAYGPDTIKQVLVLPMQPADYDGFEAKGSFFTKEFKRCETLASPSPLFDSAGIAAIRDLDKVDAACGNMPIAENPACRQILFEMFDTDHNEKLSKAELETGWRTMAYVAISHGCTFTMFFPEKAEETAPEFRKKVLALAGGKDGEATLAEIEAAWTAIAAAEEPAAMLRLIRAVMAPILPFIPQGDPVAGCVCHEVARAQ